MRCGIDMWSPWSPWPEVMVSNWPIKWTKHSPIIKSKQHLIHTSTQHCALHLSSSANAWSKYPWTWMIDPRMNQPSESNQNHSIEWEQTLTLLTNHTELFLIRCCSRGNLGSSRSWRMREVSDQMLWTSSHWFLMETWAHMFWFHKLIIIWFHGQTHAHNATMCHSMNLVWHSVHSYSFPLYPPIFLFYLI